MEFVNKEFLSATAELYVVISSLERLLKNWFTKYRNTGFYNVLASANEPSASYETDPGFSAMCWRKRRKAFE